jgi:PAS domain-containing protein
MGLAAGRVLWAGAHALWGTEGSISKDGSGADDLLAAVHPDDHVTVRSARDRAVAAAALGSDGGGYQCEYRVIGPDGRTRWLESRGRVERRSSGRAWRIVGVSLDITDRKRADEELRVSEAGYRAVIEGQTQSSLRLRPNGTLGFVKDAYCRYRGLQSLARCTHAELDRSTRTSLPCPSICVRSSRRSTSPSSTRES